MTATKKTEKAHKSNLLKVQFALILKSAIEESVDWQKLLTEFEKTKISYSDARNIVMKRVYDKHIKLIN